MTMRSNIDKNIIPDRYLCEIMLDHIYSLPPSQFSPLAILLLILTECVVVPSLPVLFLAIIVTIQTTVSWLLGTITCLPIIVIFTIILLTAKHFMPRLHK